MRKVCGAVGILELLLICAVVLLILGATRLPRLARSVGRTPGEYQAGLEEGPGGQRERREL